MTGRRRYVVTLLSTAALMATGCGGHSPSPQAKSPQAKSPRPHTVAFEITGSAKLSSLTYVINGKKATERSVKLPWKKTIQLLAKEGKDTWSLETRHNSGSSFAVAYVDGKRFTSGGCAGGGCRGGVSGSIDD